MGNKSGKHGTLLIRTDQPYYIAGGVVTGNVFVDCRAPFKGSQLMLVIEGKEESFWRVENTNNEAVNTDSNTTNTTSYTNYRGENVLYSNFTVLYNFPNGTVPRGQYSFPFVLRLHNYLPGSFREEYPAYSGLITYRLKAQVAPISEGIEFRNEQELIIREPVKDMQHSMYEELSVQPTTWCCISQGRCNIKCYFEKNSYLPGDEAFIICEVDNLQCTLNVTEIRCVLQKKVSLMSNEGNQKSFTDVVREVSFPGVPAGESRLGPNAQRMSIRLISKKAGEVIQPSTTGNLVKCEYLLTVHCSMSGCTCCTQLPEVSANIRILSPPALVEGVQAPEDWAPQVFDKHEFVVNQRNSYGNGMGGNPYIAQMNSQAALNEPMI